MNRLGVLHHFVAFLGGFLLLYTEIPLRNHQERRVDRPVRRGNGGNLEMGRRQPADQRVSVGSGLR